VFSDSRETLTTFKPNVHFDRAFLRGKTWLIPALGAALLLVGLMVVATVQAAPPGQSPTQTPSAMRGEALWAENCAPCHGVSGAGDGATAQSPQMANNPPTDFTDRTAARERSLADMFAVTKEGRMDRLMPPWGGQLSDDQIWDVVAYAQTFATLPDDLAAGAVIYRENCQECHAPDGSGTVPGAPDFTDAAAMASKSPQALFDVLSQGQGQMPAFSDQLSAEGEVPAGGEGTPGGKALTEEERWQVVDYLRTFSYEPITYEGVIAGQVKNATTGQPVGDVEVKLRRWQGEAELSPLTVQAGADGSFRFEGLDTTSHAFYRAEVLYNDVSFPGDFVNFDSDNSQLSLPLNIYETTTSDEAISVERLHFIVLGDQPGFFSVLELYQFSNSGDRAYVGTVDENGLRETVHMALPSGAHNLFLQGGTLGVDFLETDDGLVATSPIVPGKETFEAAFVYVVPYSGTTLSLDRPLYYDTASVNGLVLNVGAKLKSDVLTFGGERTAQGQTFLQYTAQDLKAGKVIPINLYDLDKIQFASTSDSSNSSTVMPSTGLRQTTLLWVMLSLGVVAIAFTVSYPSLRPRLGGETPVSESDLAQERKRLLLTLARLDQAYEDGKLNETVYRRARALRKAELAEVWRQLQAEEF
jgi:mono/diheme cytochrome c family protein